MAMMTVVALPGQGIGPEVVEIRRAPEDPAVHSAYLDQGSVGRSEHAQGDGRHLGDAADARNHVHDPGPERSARRVHELDHGARAHTKTRGGVGVETDGPP